MNPASTRDRAFSLVELTLAIGVAAVALVTIVGLLGVAVDTHGAAGRDTTIVTMTTQVLNDLRATPSFDALWAKEPRSAGSGGDGFVVKPNGVPSGTPEDTSYFFTQEGRRVERGNDGIIYECTVRKTADLPRPNQNKGPSNLLKLQLVFTSPVAANPKDPNRRPHRRIINASIARY